MVWLIFPPHTVRRNLRTKMIASHPPSVSLTYPSLPKSSDGQQVSDGFASILVEAAIVLSTLFLEAQPPKPRGTQRERTNKLCLAPKEKMSHLPVILVFELSLSVT